MKDEIKSVSGGIPVFSLLGAALIILKVLGKISISWTWVLAPFWIPAAVLVTVLALVFFIAVLATVLSS